MIIGAGCIGSAIARELSKFDLKVVWVEAADDVSQGATKGNSGIVHAGYDDTPGTNHAKYCWPGNQMFAALDRDLRFGYQKNGSLVVAFNDADLKHLDELKQRGETNGVQNLRIVDQTELRKMEPHVHREAIAALYSPDAGNVIPYVRTFAMIECYRLWNLSYLSFFLFFLLTIFHQEFAIALAENAVDNGIELRIRREVQSITHDKDASVFTAQVRHWEPEAYVKSISNPSSASSSSSGETRIQWLRVGAGVLVSLSLLVYYSTTLSIRDHQEPGSSPFSFLVAGLSALFGILAAIGSYHLSSSGQSQPPISESTEKSPAATDKNIISHLVDQAGPPIGSGDQGKVDVPDMLVGGSGSSKVQQGVTVEVESIRAKYIINCAGGASDQIANMIGDHSFKIKPRLGDYLLLHRNQVRPHGDTLL